MEKRSPVHRPKEELLGQSTPYNLKQTLLVYAVIAVIIIASSVLFAIVGTMDQFQMALTVLTLLCVALGVAQALRTSKTQVLLYDTWFQVGNDAFGYDEIYQLERRKETVTFRTGKGMRDKYTFSAGNAEALEYLISRKRQELRKAKK